MAQAIPSDCAGVTPYLIVRGASRALDFYKKAFNAVELMRCIAAMGAGGEGA